MKKPIVQIILVILIASAFSFAGFLETLEITKENAQDAVWYSFSNGGYSGPASKTYHNFAVPLRVSMIKEIGAFAKAYSQSDHFKNRYTEYRLGQRPSPPEALVTTAELKKQQREAIQKSLNDIEPRLKEYTGDIRKGMEAAVKVMKDQLKELDDPKNPMFSPDMDVILKQSHDEQVKEYESKVKEWELKYPVSPQGMIKDRLNYFLQLSATVDFSAKLGKGPEDKMIFLNQAYEEQSSDWKFIYRSGKDATNAARTVAIQWLGELK